MRSMCVWADRRYLLTWTTSWHATYLLHRLPGTWASLPTYPVFFTGGFQASPFSWTILCRFLITAWQQGLSPCLPFNSHPNIELPRFRREGHCELRLEKGRKRTVLIDLLDLLTARLPQTPTCRLHLKPAQTNTPATALRSHSHRKPPVTAAVNRLPPHSKQTFSTSRHRRWGDAATAKQHPSLGTYKHLPPSFTPQAKPPNPRRTIFT